MSYRDLFRGWVFGSPAEADHRPDKDQAVIIGDRLDGDLAEVSGYGNRITALENSQQGGNLGAETLAELNALAVTLGLGEVDIGKIGEVFNDPDPANNGSYLWTGSAWSYTGLGRLGVLEGKVVQNDRRINAPLAFSRKPILDLDNLYGGGDAYYVPRSGTFQTQEDGEVFAISLTADSKMTDHHKVLVPNTNNLIWIYYDRVDAVVRVAVAGTARMPRNTDRYFLLIAIYGRAANGLGAGKAGVFSPYVYETTSASKSVVARVDGALCYDPATSTLLVPEVYGYNEGNAPWTLSPISGKYRELTGMATSAIQQVYVDAQDLRLNGSLSPNALKTLSGFAGSGGTTPAVSRDGGGRLVLLGTQRGGSFTPADGVTLAELVPNQYPFGKEGNDYAEYVRHPTGAPDSTPVDLVDSAALALGFTRGWSNASGTIYYGGYFEKQVRGGHVTARFFLEADADGAFGEPRAYFIWVTADGLEDVTRVNLGEGLALVKQHSPRMREYEVTLRVANNRVYSGIFVGSAEGAASAVRVFGLQYFAGAALNPFISRNDYPRPATLDPLIPDELRFVQGRGRYPIYLDQLTRVARPSRAVFSVGPTSSPGVSGPVAVKHYPFGGALDPEGTGQRIWVRDDKVGRSGQVWFKDVDYIEQVVTPKPINVLCIGDSYFDGQGAGPAVLNRLADMGFTVTSIGTRTMVSPYGDGDWTGEGRASREFGDYIHAITTNMAPVTNWSSYLALSNAAKAGFNPLLVADAGPNSRNGYKFSIAPYLAGAGLTTPDVVLVNLHINDETGKATVAAAVTNVVDGIRIMTEEIHADLPGVPIFFVVTGSGWRREEIRQEGVHWAVIKAMTATVRALRDGGDTDVYLVPAYAAVSRDIGYRYSETVGPDGVVSAKVSDATHTGVFGTAQFGEIAAQTVASVVGA